MCSTARCGCGSKCRQCSADPSLPGASFQLPKIEWVQPTVEFLSPTFAEFLLFLVTLILFIASWRDLRRGLVMTFGDRESRLRTLRIINAIEEHLGGYLLMVTVINLGVGVATGIICAVTGMPNPAALGALAATLNFIPIIGPVFMFVILTVVGVIAFPTLAGGLLGPALFAGMTFLEGHFLTPVIVGRRLAIECARRVHRAGVLDLAVGTDGRLPGLADPDRGADHQGPSAARRFAAVAGALTGRSPVSASGTSRKAKRLWPMQYERLEKDVAAVKNDISALTDQITDVLNAFAGSAGKQARRGYKEARANVNSAYDDLYERGSAMMDSAYDAASSMEESLEDAITQRPLATVGIALGIGFLIGAAWRR